MVFIFNFIDRQILGILATPIKTDLGLNDTQLGLLGGFAFAILYSTAALPLAWLADRTSKSWVITLSLGAFSGFTALCGLATGFWHLFWCRVGVGVGEAGGVAPSYALIADYFPPQTRGRALSIYSLGIPLGGGIGVLISGYLASTVNWRFAFFAVGLLGIVITPLVRLLVRDLPTAGKAPPARIADVAKVLAHRKSFWLLSIAAASTSIVNYGVMFWLPSLMQRAFSLTLLQTTQFIGALLLTAGIAGILLGGVLGDWLGRKNPGHLARIPAVSFLFAAPLFAAGFLSQTPLAAFLLLLVPQTLAFVWFAPVISAIQQLVPPNMRATASAVFLLINNLVGPTIGVLVVGLLSDKLAPALGGDALRWAMVFCLVFYLISAALLFTAVRPLQAESLP